MLLKSLVAATLALSASAIPAACGPDPSGEVIKASFIAPRDFPNCGFAGTSCGSAKGPGGKTNYYCAPFKATCCNVRQTLEESGRVGNIFRRHGGKHNEEEEGDDEDNEEVDVEQIEGEDGTGDAGSTPIFGKPDGRFSYCPDGYDCSGDGRWCTRRADATVNTNQPGSTRSNKPSSTSEITHVSLQTPPPKPTSVLPPPPKPTFSIHPLTAKPRPYSVAEKPYSVAIGDEV